MHHCLAIDRNHSNLVILPPHGIGYGMLLSVLRRIINVVVSENPRSGCSVRDTKMSEPLNNNIDSIYTIKCLCS